MGLLEKIQQKLRGEYKASDIKQYRAKISFVDQALASGKLTDPKLVAYLSGLKKGLEITIATLSDSFWFGRDLSRTIHGVSPLYPPLYEFLDHSDGRLSCLGVSYPVPQSDVDKYSFSNDFLEFLFPIVMERAGFPITDDEFFLEGFYELGEGEPVRLKRGDVVFDCGANQGFFTGQALIRGAAKVYAFEPMRHIIEKYLGPVASFNPNIEICPYGLADKLGRVAFEVERHNSHMAGRGDKKRRLRKNKAVEVELTTLDDFVTRNRIDRVDFIKADIEGAERLMLAGARETIRRFSPRVSICTYHLSDDPDVLRNMLLNIQPGYHIIEKPAKIYAYVE